MLFIPIFQKLKEVKHVNGVKINKNTPRSTTKRNTGAATILFIILTCVTGLDWHLEELFVEEFLKVEVGTR